MNSPVFFDFIRNTLDAQLYPMIQEFLSNDVVLKLELSAIVLVFCVARSYTRKKKILLLKRRIQKERIRRLIREAEALEECALQLNEPVMFVDSVKED